MKPIHQAINQALASIALEQLARDMGYARPAILRDRLHQLLQSPWMGLEHAEFNGEHATTTFFHHLLDALGIGDLGAGDAMNEFRDAADAQEGFRPWIFVETNFTSRHYAIAMFALMEPWRRIPLPKAVKRYSDDKRLAFLEDFIRGFMAIIQRQEPTPRLPEVAAALAPLREKYAASTFEPGHVSIWGTPRGFRCFFERDEAWRFDLHGRLIERSTQPVPEPARIMINNRRLTFL